MTSMTGKRRIVIPVLGLAVASALSGVLMVASSSTSYAMPGMGASGSTPTPTMADDMPGMDMGGSTPTPTPSMAADMPGMDMGGSTPTPTPTMDADMPGMDMGGTSHDEHGDTADATSDRPLAPVLGTFGGAASAVMLGAGLLRRKDRAAEAVKQAARAARRAQK